MDAEEGTTKEVKGLVCKFEFMAMERIIGTMQAQDFFHQVNKFDTIWM